MSERPRLCSSSISLLFLLSLSLLIFSFSPLLRTWAPADLAL